MDSTNVYGMSGGDQNTFGSIVACSTGGCGRPTPLTGGVPWPSGLAVDDTNVYWGQIGFSSGDGKLVKCAVGGCTGSTVIAAALLSRSPDNVAVDSTSVYWTESGSSTDDAGAFRASWIVAKLAK